MEIRFAAQIETDYFGEKQIVEYDNKRHYVAALYSDTEVLERRLVPVDTPSETIENLLREMVDRADSNIKFAIEALREWTSEFSDPLFDLSRFLDEELKSVGKIPEPGRTPIGFAARDIKRGEIIQYSRFENTNDILVKDLARHGILVTE